MKFLAILGLAVIAVNSTNLVKHDDGCENDEKSVAKKEYYKKDQKKENEIESHRDNRRGDDNGDRSKDKDCKEGNSQRNKSNQKDCDSFKGDRRQEKDSNRNSRGSPPKVVYPKTAEIIVRAAEVTENKKEDNKVAKIAEVKETYKNYRYDDQRDDRKNQNEKKDDCEEDDKNKDKRSYKGDKKDNNGFQWRDWKVGFKGNKQDNKKVDYRRNDNKGDEYKAGKWQDSYEKIAREVKFAEQKKEDQKNAKIVEVKQSYKDYGHRSEKTVETKASQIKENKKEDNKISQIVEVKETYSKNGKADYRGDDRDGKWNQQYEKAVKAVEAQEKHKQDEKSIKSIEIKENFKADTGYLRNNYGQKGGH